MTAISIHGPRGGPDPPPDEIILKIMNFNPRAPRGARPWANRKAGKHRTFQSTGPAGGPTFSSGNSRQADVFQSTGPAGGPTT